MMADCMQCTNAVNRECQMCEMIVMSQVSRSTFHSNSLKKTSHSLDYVERSHHKLGKVLTTPIP
jgi:hypothetical protein